MSHPLPRWYAMPVLGRFARAARRLELATLPIDARGGLDVEHAASHLFPEVDGRAVRARMLRRLIRQVNATAPDDVLRHRLAVLGPRSGPRRLCVTGGWMRLDGLHQIEDLESYEAEMSARATSPAAGISCAKLEAGVERG